MSQEKVDSFYKLTPDEVLSAAEEVGYYTTGEYLQLNSYENRVFEIFLEENQDQPNRIIAKFYRPLRWSKEALQEEHDFLRELNKNDIPAVAPVVLSGQTVIEQHGLYASYFPKVWGRMPQELFLDELTQVGSLLARLHNVGSLKRAEYRPELFKAEACDAMVDELERWVAPEVYGRYKEACFVIIDYLQEHLDPSEDLRIHGDCHRGNLLIKDPPPGSEERRQFFLVDFDDFVNGPAIQDFWMLFSSAKGYDQELQALIKGYELLREFPDHQLKLIDPLRGLRIFKYAFWIASRWQDPTFPKLFPDFQDYNYWAEEVEALESIAWSLK